MVKIASDWQIPERYQNSSKFTLAPW